MTTEEPLKSPAPRSKAHLGRPRGSRNFGGGISFVAQQFHREGYDWRHELVAAYTQYKCAHDIWLKDATQPKPEPELLDFWTRMMPYITQTVAEKDAHKRQRNVSNVKKYKISHAAMENLAEAEGRKP